MDEENFIEDQILKHLEGIITEVIIGVVHCKMMVMSGYQYIFSAHKPNNFLETDSFSE